MNRFWMIYDFGVQGEYSRLYSWLDDVKAEECGDMAATFESQKTREEVSKAIVKALGTKGRGRIYLIGRNDKGKVVGGFISGRRKAPIWQGSSSRGEQEKEEEA